MRPSSHASGATHCPHDIPGYAHRPTGSPLSRISPSPLFASKETNCSLSDSCWQKPQSASGKESTLLHSSSNYGCSKAFAAPRSHLSPAFAACWHLPFTPPLRQLRFIMGLPDLETVLRGKYPAKDHAARVSDVIRSKTSAQSGVLYLEGRMTKLQEDNDSPEPFRHVSKSSGS